MSANPAAVAFPNGLESERAAKTGTPLLKKQL